MKNLIKSAKTIRNLAITCFICLILLIVFAVLLIKEVSDYSSKIPSSYSSILLEEQEEISYVNLIAYLALLLISGIVLSICHFISVIKILATDWKNERLNKDKILWGILSLLILGPLASLIFGFIAVNTLQNEESTSNSDMSSEKNNSEKIDSGISSTTPEINNHKTNEEW